MGEMRTLKKGEFVDYYEKTKGSVFVYLVLEDGEYVGILRRKEK